jgi:hypothetical protein
MTGDRKGSKGRYMTGKQVDNYLNWQAEIKQLREEQKQIHDLLAEVLPPKNGFPQAGVLLWGLESELKRVVGKIAIIMGMAEREEE